MKGSKRQIKKQIRNLLTKDERLHEQLVENLGYIRKSCTAYDNGDIAEAKRILTPMRVLFHNPKKDCLLHKMGVLNHIRLFTPDNYTGPKNLLTESQLVHLKMTATGEVGKTATGMKGEVLPALEGGLRKKVPYDQWWHEIVLDDKKGHKMTRKQIVCDCCNKEGITHTDKSTNRFQAIAKEHSMNWVFNFNGQEWPAENFMWATARQMGHEVLRSLNTYLNAK